MPLWLLGLLVAGGISMIVLIVHATGGSQVAAFTGKDTAIARWSDDFPEERPDAVILSADRQLALFRLKGHTGVSAAMGDCFLTRLLAPADIAAASVQGTALELKLADFTFTGGRWLFETPDDARRALAWLAQSAEKTDA